MSPSITVTPSSSTLLDYVGNLIECDSLDPANIYTDKWVRKPTEKACKMGKSFAISANLDKAAQQAIKMAMFAVIAELKGIELMFEEVKQHVDWPL